jgi:F-type H+-transporting ATPase subunit epsilon
MLKYNTTEGYVGILPGHVAMTQILAPGKLAIYEEGKPNPTYMAAMSGISKIMPDTIMLLLEIAELKDEIDVERAKIAKKKAEDRIAENNDPFEVERAKFSLKKAETRLEVAAI